MNEPPLNDAQLHIQQQLALLRAMERALAERAEMLREARDYLSDAGIAERGFQRWQLSCQLRASGLTAV